MRERDVVSQNAIAAIGVSGTSLPQPPMFVEASSRFGHFTNPTTIHQHRSQVNLPLVGGLIYGGSSGIGNNVTLVTLAPAAGTGFFRAFFRVKGICPLIAWDPVTPLDIVESQWHLKPYMWEAFLDSRTTFNSIQGNVISTVRFQHHPDDNVGPPQEYLSRQVLNRTATATTTVPLGSYSIDRIVSFSIKASIGGEFHVRQAGHFWLAGPGQAWYESPPTTDISWPITDTQAEIDALQGTPLSVPNNTGDLLWRNDAQINPLSLLPPHSPMIPVVVGTPLLTNYLEVQYIGHRPEASARAEETLDLVPPLLVTTLP